MKILKSYTFRWFEMALLKLSLLALGIFAGLHWPHIFQDISSGLLGFAGLALLFLFITMRKQIFK